MIAMLGFYFSDLSKLTDELRVRARPCLISGGSFSTSSWTTLWNIELGAGALALNASGSSFCARAKWAAAATSSCARSAIRPR